MTHSAAPAPPRLSLGQTIGWLVAFLVVVALVVMFFVFRGAAQPLFGWSASSAVWLTS